MITFEKYRAIEWTLDRVRGHIGSLATKEVKDDLTSAVYIIGVVRSYAQTFETLPIEERGEALENLFTALYR